jgi:pilus assembly protein CpaF
MERMRDGTRRVTHITEVQGIEGETIVMQDLFVFEQTGIQNGRVMGKLVSTGLRPKFAEKFAVNSIDLPPDIFASQEHVI